MAKSPQLLASVSGLQSWEVRIAVDISLPLPYRGGMVNAYIWPWKWPDPKTGPYEVVVRMGELEGRFEVLGLEVRSIGDKLRVTSTVLRSVRLDELATRTAALIVPMHTDHWAVETVSNEADMDEEWHRKREEAVFPMREAFLRLHRAIADRATTEATLEGVARIYIDARRRHQHPTKAVAEALGITYAKAAHLVVDASKGGLLGKTTRGRQRWGGPASVERK